MFPLVLKNKQTCFSPQQLDDLLDEATVVEASEDFLEAAVEGGAGARERRPLDQFKERTLAEGDWEFN